MKAVRRNRLMSMGNTLYDAAKATGARDLTFLAWPQFAEKEFTQYTRETILRKKRYLEANLSVVGSLIKKVGRYAIGEGLYPIPETTDKEWNELVKEGFIEWASNPTVCDAVGRWTFWEMQKYAAESLFGEGEAFFALVNSSVKAAPQLQAFDNFEIRYIGASGAAPGSLEGSETTYWDGVKLNKNGRVVAYAVQTTDGGAYQDVDAPNMVHVAEFKRPNQVRAISPFHASANSAVDALDIRGLETTSAKLHSALGIVRTSTKGSGIGEGGLTGSLEMLLQSATTPNGDSVPTGQDVIGENFFSGGAIAHLAAGEDLKLLASNRPAPDLVAFLQWLYRDIAESTGLPVELVWDGSQLGGVNARIMLADAQYFFDHIQKKIAKAFCERVYKWWVSVQINNGNLPKCQDPKWWHCAWQGPRKLDIDRNQVNADIQALDAGLMTQQDYYRSRGVDWQAKIIQRISERKFADDQCKAVGLNYADVFPSKPGSAPLSAPESFSGSSSAPQPNPAAMARSAVPVSPKLSKGNDSIPLSG